MSRRASLWGKFCFERGNKLCLRSCKYTGWVKVVYDRKKYIFLQLHYIYFCLQFHNIFRCNLPFVCMYKTYKSSYPQENKVIIFTLTLCESNCHLWVQQVNTQWYVSHNFIDPRDKGPIMGALLYHQIAPFVWEILSSDPHILRTYSLFSLANYYKVLLTSTCT